MKLFKNGSLFFLISLIFVNCIEKKKDNPEDYVKILNNETEQKVDVLINDQIFTSYLYRDNIPVLKKTVLYPIVASNGVTITRGFPLETRPGERTDHPHHIGAWFNYGDANGIDYWNNSDAINEEHKHKMGIIRHDQIIEIIDGNSKGELLVSANWLKPDGEILLKEKSKFIFYSQTNQRMIDRIATLTAEKEHVLFNDNKEGAFAIRVARQLEHPSDHPVKLSDMHGKETDVPVLNNEGVSGNYLSSEGIEGMDVWGKRAKWIALDGVINNKEVTVVIFDNPKNVGYPTYWHARGYGLFAANPFGQNVFSEGKESLNYSLKAGDSVTFKYRILIIDGEKNKKKIESEYQKFIKEN